MQLIINLIDIIIWPIITITLAFLFKKPLTSLIGRIREVGKEGIKVGAEPIQPESTDIDSKSTNLIKAFDSALKREMESLIYTDLKDEGFTDKNKTTDVLVQHLAAVQLQLKFELIHQIIWGSQVKLLNFLNSSPTPIDKNGLFPFYQSASVQYPDAYNNYPFENYLNYLEQSELVVVNNSQYQISEFGR